MLDLLKSMLQLILAPSNGWEDVSLDDEERGAPPVRAFYTFTLIISLSWLAPFLYDPDFTLLMAFEAAVITYVTWFVSYFIGSFALSVALQAIAAREVVERSVHSLVINGLSLLGLILLLSNLLPMPTPMLWFMPLYLLVILWKGASFLGVKPSRGAIYTAICALTVIAPPILLGSLFKALL